MLVHGVDEGADVLRVHVGVQAVAEVGDVAPGSETLQHLPHHVRNLFLNQNDELSVIGDYF